jgi:hypothetical protein
MATKNSGTPAREGREARTAAGRTAGTKALQEEAERGWAVSDEKAAKGRRRSQANAKRRGEARGRDAEISRLRGKLAELEPARVRKSKPPVKPTT